MGFKFLAVTFALVYLKTAVERLQADVSAFRRGLNLSYRTLHIVFVAQLLRPSCRSSIHIPGVSSIFVLNPGRFLCTCQTQLPPSVLTRNKFCALMRSTFPLDSMQILHSLACPFSSIPLNRLLLSLLKVQGPLFTSFHHLSAHIERKKILSAYRLLLQGRWLT
jgi:hypothetical protein